MRSLIQAKSGCIQAFQTNSVTSSEQSPWRVLVNGGNSVPGGLTQDWDRDRTGLGAWCVGLYSPRLSLVGLFTCPTRLLYDNGLLSAFMQPLAAFGVSR